MCSNLLHSLFTVTLPVTHHLLLKTLASTQAKIKQLLLESGWYYKQACCQTTMKYLICCVRALNYFEKEV